MKGEAKTPLSAGKVLATGFERCFASGPKTGTVSLERCYPFTIMLNLTQLLTRVSHFKIYVGPSVNTAHSPDLLPCDAHMFGPLKESLRGKLF